MTRRGSHPTIHQQHRTDIDGLRAVAVLLVVFFHANVPGFDGGFVGVDVFFVISGYLITRKLMEELSERGSIDLIRFWLGRAKRLLPAASLMIATTLVVQLVVRNPLHWDDAISEAWAAAFYFSNEAVARTSFGYFDATRVQRALLHTWSLSVEEQFYFAWPLILSMAVGAKLRRATVVVVGLIVGSFALSAVLTAINSPFAYLGAASRAWEFLLGAALALPIAKRAFPRITESPRTAQRLAVAGLGAIVVSAVVLSEEGGFPVPTALIPVLGTAAIIAASVDESSPIGTVLGWDAVQRLGRLSYSWYLWHWPVLVLGIEILRRATLAWRVGLVCLALVPAVLSNKFVENPIRRMQPRSLSGVAMVGLVMPSLLVVGALFVAMQRDSATFAPPQALALRDAQNDWPEQFDDCNVPDLDVLMRHCVGGDETAETTMLLVGDSHAAHWFPALDAAGSNQGIRLVALHQGNCPATILSTDPGLLDDCRRVIDELDDVIAHVDPSIIVTSHADSYAIDRPDDWQAGLASLAERLERDGLELIVIHDVPRFAVDPILCLARTGATAAGADAACSMSRSAVEQRAEPVRAAEQAVADSFDNVVIWDPIDLLCEPAVCSPRREGVPMYIDAHHITVSHSTTLADALEPTLLRALEAAGSR